MKKVFLLVMLVAGILFVRRLKTAVSISSRPKCGADCEKSEEGEKADFRRLLHFLVRPV